MDSTPPYHKSEPKSRTKSSSRLSKLRFYNEENEVVTPNLSLEIVPSSPAVVASPSPSKSPCGLPVHELLLFSPSPLRKSKTRLADKLEMADDAAEPNGARRRSKNRNSASGLLAHPSPRNHRRSRRRFEQDLREDKDFGIGEDMIKPRKKRHSGRSKKDKLSLVPSIPSPSMPQLILILMF